MDTAYDMNKQFTPEQSRSQIWTLLLSCRLQKYMEPITRAGIDFHAFCNLTRDDMRHVGILNHQDQDTLIELVRPMATMYRELENHQINWAQVRNNLVQSSEILAGSLVDLRKTMKKYPIEHQSLVDYDTPSTRAILVLLDLIQSRVDFMNQDLKEILRKQPKDLREPKASRRKKLFSGALLAVAAVSAVWLLKFPKSPAVISFLSRTCFSVK